MDTQDNSESKENISRGLALPPGITLGNYQLLHKIGQGGFGITYLAQNIQSLEQVVIKENLPIFYACRNDFTLQVHPLDNENAKEDYAHSLQRFIEEARTLARLNHPNIIQVYEAFEALGTAYYVMPYIEAKELHKSAPTVVDEAWLLPILKTILGALEYLHKQNLLHRDIKPNNILLQKDGTPLLIDFGTARALQTELSATMVGTPGYTPIEQITSRGKRGPWTDVYALGATCYRLITGQVPPEANARLAEDEDSYRPLSSRKELLKYFTYPLLKSIDTALAIRAKNRWQTAQAWLDSLKSISIAPRTVIPVPYRQQKSNDSTHKRNHIPFLFGLLAVIILGGAFGVYSYLDKLEQEQILEEYKLAENKRIQQEQIERQKREEAERIAREEAERKAKEERLAQEEAERKEKEERLVQEEAERKEKEEAERIAQAEAQRIAREEAKKAALQEEWNNYCLSLFTAGHKFSGEWFRDSRFGEISIEITKTEQYDKTVQFIGIVYDTKLPQAKLDISGRCELNKSSDGTSKIDINIYDGFYDPDQPTAEVFDAKDGVLQLYLNGEGKLSGVMTCSSWENQPDKAFKIHMASNTHTTESKKTAEELAWHDFCVSHIVPGKIFSGKWLNNKQSGSISLKINKTEQFDKAVQFIGIVYDTKLPKAKLDISGRCELNKSSDGTSKIAINIYDGFYDPDQPTAQVFNAKDGIMQLRLDEEGKISGVMTRLSWKDQPEKGIKVSLSSKK